APLRAHGCLHDYRPNSTGGDYDERVIGSKMESFQNLLGIAFVILEIQWRTQSVRAHDRGMIRERQFHQGDETGEATLARGHFLAHHPGVAVAEKKDQAATRNPIGT